MSKKKKIMGIDPGTVCTGYGIIETSSRLISPLDFGCIKPPSKLPLEKRYLIIYNALELLIEKHKPDVVAIETQFMKKNFQSAMKIGMARGMAILAATKQDIPIFEYAPKKAKLAVVGTGKASKHQVKQMIAKMLNLSTTNFPEDAADALALAICHTHQLN